MGRGVKGNKSHAVDSSHNGDAGTVSQCLEKRQEKRGWEIGQILAIDCTRHGRDPVPRGGEKKGKGEKKPVICCNHGFTTNA